MLSNKNELSVIMTCAIVASNPSCQGQTAATHSCDASSVRMVVPRTTDRCQLVAAAKHSYGGWSSLEVERIDPDWSTLATQPEGHS
jgi:hypothetical protein